MTPDQSDTLIQPTKNPRHLKPWSRMTATVPSPAAPSLATPVVADVSRVGVVFVNLYAIDLPNGEWVLVDTGLPVSAWYVRKALESEGRRERPLAIVLTHAHFDHAGNVAALAEQWDVPVYVHQQELPYVTGREDYPPQDPTPGGAICFLSRFFPRSGIDLGRRVQPLPADGSVPHLPEWRWLHTPGHTVGHVSLFRERDGVLLAGDAVATVDLDAWSSQFTWPRELARPATPFTPDWEAARASIEKLADLSPRVVAAGHGLPIRGRDLGEDLRGLARSMPEPEGGRYAGHPVQYAPDGTVAFVPPAVEDPLPKTLGAAAAVLLAAAGTWAMTRRRES